MTKDMRPDPQSASRSSGRGRWAVSGWVDEAAGSTSLRDDHASPMGFPGAGVMPVRHCPPGNLPRVPVAKVTSRDASGDGAALGLGEKPGHPVEGFPATLLPEPADPLDQDLAAYFDDRRSDVVRVDILGPVRIRASGPIERKRIPLCTELVIYLAVHGNRLFSATQLDFELWPDHPIRPSTRTEAIARARKWLGRNSRGDLHLPPSHRGELRLDQAVLLDWDLFQRLTARGRARGERGANDLATALQMVRGRPFEGVPPTRYRWLPRTCLEQDMLTAVIETAHDLARHLLRVGDPRRARDAARIAQHVDRYDERPWRDLLEAEHLLGNSIGVRSTVRELIQSLDVESVDELEPETCELIARLGRRRAALGPLTR